MNREKKEMSAALMIIAFAIIIMIASMFAINDLNARQAALTGRFIFDNGCYGVRSDGKLSCIASNIGKKCVNGCYLAKTNVGESCECLQE